jgi:hypothetical protein
MQLRASFLALSAALLCCPFVAHAQDAKPPKAAPAADPNLVRQQLYDLALLHALQDVNLTEDQLKTILPIVKEIAESDKDRRQKDDDAIREIAADVAKARTEAVAGTLIPKELEDRVVEVQKTIVARAATARRAAIEKILADFWPILTETQKTAMEVQSRAFYGGRRVPAPYRSNPTKAPKAEVQKLAVGAFVENVLLDDRCLPLLESLKPLKTETTAAEAPPADSSPGARKP